LIDYAVQKDKETWENPDPSIKLSNQHLFNKLNSIRMEQLCNQNNQLLCYMTADKQSEDLKLKRMA